jgi:4-carboxymuconolactone decarboxylase
MNDSRPLDIEARGAEIDAREAEILGKPQRIRSLTADEYDEEANSLILRVRQSLKSATTKVSDVFGLMLRHPGLFRCQMDMGIQLLGKGEISPRERELAILRVGWWCGAPFEWVEHVVVAKRYEITSEEIERVTQGSAAPGWSEHERAILKGVEELLGKQMISDDTWEILARTWNEKQLIEFPVLVGQYFTVALQQNSLRVPLDRECDGLRMR